MRAQLTLAQSYRMISQRTGRMRTRRLSHLDLAQYCADQPIQRYVRPVSQETAEVIGSQRHGEVERQLHLLSISLAWKTTTMLLVQSHHIVGVPLEVTSQVKQNTKMPESSPRLDTSKKREEDPTLVQMRLLSSTLMLEIVDQVVSPTTRTALVAAPVMITPRRNNR
jgi:hypothetical protein